jgi:hypothetical protein
MSTPNAKAICSAIRLQPKSHLHVKQNETSEVTALMCWAFQFGWR